MTEYVYLIEENVFAELLQRSAHFARVRYSKDGLLFELDVESDAYEDIE